MLSRLISYLFKEHQTQNTHWTHTRDLELTRDAGAAYGAFPMNAFSRQITEKRHLRWACRLVRVTVQLPCGGNTEAPGRRVLPRAPWSSLTPIAFNLHVKWETDHRCAGTGLWFVLWSLWTHASCRKEERGKHRVNMTAAQQWDEDVQLLSLYFGPQCGNDKLVYFDMQWI